MEEQNTGEANVEHDRPDQPDRVEGVAKVIRAGGEAGGRRLMRAGGGGNGAADAAAAAAEPVMRAGRVAAEGVQAAAEAAEDVAEDAGVHAGQALQEWAGCARRAYLRNTRAMIDLTQCRTVYGLMQWQGNLLTETASDVLHTNSRILRLVLNKA